MWEPPCLLEQHQHSAENVCIILNHLMHQNLTKRLCCSCSIFSYTLCLFFIFFIFFPQRSYIYKNIKKNLKKRILIHATYTHILCWMYPPSTHMSLEKWIISLKSDYISVEKVLIINNIIGIFLEYITHNLGCLKHFFCLDKIIIKINC